MYERSRDVDGYFSSMPPLLFHFLLSTKRPSTLFSPYFSLSHFHPPKFYNALLLIYV